MERNVIALGHHKPQNDLPPVLPSPPGELQGQPASGLLEGPVAQMPVTLLLGQWRPGAPGGSWCEWLHSEALLRHPTQWTAGGETCTAALRHCIFAVFKLKSFDSFFFLVVTFPCETGSCVRHIERINLFLEIMPIMSLMWTVIWYLQVVY